MEVFYYTVCSVLYGTYDKTCQSKMLTRQSKNTTMQSKMLTWQSLWKRHFWSNDDVMEHVLINGTSLVLPRVYNMRGRVSYSLYYSVREYMTFANIIHTLCVSQFVHITTTKGHLLQYRE